MDHEHFRRMHGRNGAKMARVSVEVALKAKALVANDTWAFRFERTAGFTYQAGRHVRMTLLKPRYRDKKGASRFFSFASAPQETDLVFAMRMRDSAFKRSLMALAIGDAVRIEILVNPPPGAFAFDDAAEGPVAFLAGGIGVVPAYSMIRDVIARGLHRPLYLFYSARTPSDAPYLAELKDLAAHHPSVVFIPTMTGVDGSWCGRAGRIDLDLVRQVVEDIPSTTFYIAGLPDMVSAMRMLLGHLSVPSDHILAEEFEGFTPHRTGRGGLATIAIGAAVTIALGLHLAAGAFVMRLGGLDLKNPMFAIGAGLVVAVVIVKLLLVLRSGHKK